MKKKIIVIVFAMFVCGVCASTGFAAFNETQAHEDFAQAAQAYQKGDYASAVKAYEKILSQGKESGNLYFNLGNAYYKMGNIAKARLNYERAYQLMPRDSDLKYNYDFLLSKIPSKEYDRKGLVPKVVFLLERNATLNEFVFVMIATIILFCGISAMGLYSRWPLKAQAVNACVCLLILTTCFLGLEGKKEYQKDAVVLSDAKAMFEPKTASTTHFSLKEGMKVKVIKNEGQWIKVQRPDGKLGWILGSELERIN